MRLGTEVLNYSFCQIYWYYAVLTVKVRTCIVLEITDVHIVWNLAWLRMSHTLCCLCCVLAFLLGHSPKCFLYPLPNLKVTETVHREVKLSKSINLLKFTCAIGCLSPVFRRVSGSRIWES